MDTWSAALAHVMSKLDSSILSTLSTRQSTICWHASTSCGGGSVFLMVASSLSSLGLKLGFRTLNVSITIFNHSDQLFFKNGDFLENQCYDHFSASMDVIKVQIVHLLSYMTVSATKKVKKEKIEPNSKNLSVHYNFFADGYLKNVD
jgi:hypothetical protein